MSRTGNVYRSLQGQIKRRTEKAILFQPILVTSHEVPAAEWFPISQCSSIHEGYDEIEGTFDVIMASEWILGQKGMLKYAGAAGVNPVTSASVVKPPVERRAQPRDIAPPKQYKDDTLDDFPDDIPY